MWVFLVLAGKVTGKVKSVHNDSISSERLEDFEYSLRTISTLLGKARPGIRSRLEATDATRPLAQILGQEGAKAMTPARPSVFREALQVSPERIATLDDTDLNVLMRELLCAQAYRCCADI